MLGVQARPARVGLEERDAQLWVPFRCTTGDERGHRRHLVTRKADAVHLDVTGEPVRANPICNDW